MVLGFPGLDLPCLEILKTRHIGFWDVYGLLQVLRGGSLCEADDFRLIDQVWF